VIELDARSFNRAERLEVQQRFDVEFSDVITYLFEMINPGRTGAMPFALVERDGETRHFGDEVLQFMVWVQAKRVAPAAALEAYDEVALADLTSAHVRGILGKARGGTTK
jgi:hypothetical protein